MLKPKSNEKPKKQIGYLKRAREMQELAPVSYTHLTLPTN